MPAQATHIEEVRCLLPIYLVKEKPRKQYRAGDIQIDLGFIEIKIPIFKPRPVTQARIIDQNVYLYSFCSQILEYGVMLAAAGKIKFKAMYLHIEIDPYKVGQLGQACAWQGNQSQVYPARGQIERK
jgi:hypothetical protein